ncbi:hypothetical protein [Bdellovibrio sp. HCB337]|uniref:hypothetical protein n=1 Tax=Bdellovibrio sp. HCB337 TaxID=3394358 RepID=UPI0039A4716B
MKTKPWMTLAGASLLLGAVACTQTEKTPMTTESLRAPSSLQEETPRLIYVTYGKDGKANREEITAARWLGQNGGFSAGGREDYLLKMYYSNTRNTSLKGLRHASCFHGDAKTIAKNFFEKGPAETEVRNLASRWPEVKPSTDGRMLGLSLDHNSKGRLTFRIAHCESGKSSISDTVISNWAEGKPSKKISGMKTAKRTVANSPQDDGFNIFDDTPFSEDLPLFKLRADYNRNPQRPDPKPWAGLDLKDQRQALKFTLLVQKYFYENMANQNPNKRDFNFIAQNNKQRYWCHMPWMHVGAAGREAIHGMTKERDLVPSKRIPTYQNATPGSNWGVAYFNGEGCDAIGEVFGSQGNHRPEPDFTKSTFRDGTVITKMLFTTARFSEIEHAYKWRATVSDVGSTERSVQDVRHIQMDIAVKDLSLKGTDPTLGHWIMAGFYYDPNYDFEKELKAVLGEENPLKSIPNLPKELLKMRPIGVQTGFDSPEKNESLIFPGAYANGSGGRLNGPADNPKTSCLGCHAAAGTGASMIPGFLSARMWEPFLGKPALDFNQQFALAKENYETTFTGQ